jgi:hypothetical protein
VWYLIPAAIFLFLVIKYCQARHLQIICHQTRWAIDDGLFLAIAS